jgi:hypothetical protein
MPGVLLFPCPFLTLMLILVWLDSQAPTLTAILICICSASVLTAQNSGKLLSFLPCLFLYSLMMLKINILIQSFCDSVSLSIVESLLANFKFKFNRACVWLCFFLHWIWMLSCELWWIDSVSLSIECCCCWVVNCEFVMNGFIVI